MMATKVLQLADHGQNHSLIQYSEKVKGAEWNYYLYTYPESHQPVIIFLEPSNYSFVKFDNNNGNDLLLLKKKKKKIHIH